MEVILVQPQCVKNWVLNKMTNFADEKEFWKMHMLNEPIYG